jgi:succinate dehydrogenase / fumarate reductase membrane anchor subunit
MSRKARIASAGAPGRGGTMTFVLQRGSALALLVLAPWFALAAPLAARDGYDGVRDFFLQPVNTGAMGVLVVAACLHMYLGITEVIEDYMHKPFGKNGLMALNGLVCFAAAVAGVAALAALNRGA